MLQALQNMSWSSWLLSVIDISIVAYGLYRFFLLIRGTRAVQLIKGIVLLLVAVPVSNWLHLYTTHYVLQQIQMMLVVALPIVFQPELRRALEHIGQGRFFSEGIYGHEEFDRRPAIEEIVQACVHLSKQHIGALFVLERMTGLNEYAATGTPIDAKVCSPLLENIFVPNTPLHDGACIIRGDRVVAAAAFLPLTESVPPGSEIGSRHRAALGISEQSDAVAVVVSEETGWISIALEGRLTRRLTERGLRELLMNLLQAKTHTPLKLWRRGVHS
ncbi:MAG: diadenylate cyclase CdaA [Firmicutes bacterium]|nr:diadenylate cyclase CdaA [Bacillota bacterium]